MVVMSYEGEGEGIRSGLHVDEGLTPEKAEAAVEFWLVVHYNSGLAQLRV